MDIRWCAPPEFDPPPFQVPAREMEAPPWKKNTLPSPYRREYPCETVPVVGANGSYQPGPPGRKMDETGLDYVPFEGFLVVCHIFVSAGRCRSDLADGGRSALIRSAACVDIPPIGVMGT
ncbi:hypothetical protein GCM10023212_21160 [Luteolibacter yonseiensis]